MTLDDPRLTAYALGELEGPEAAEVAAAVKANAALRDEVERIRASAEQLTAGLRVEATAGLGAARHAALEARLAARPAVAATVALGRSHWWRLASFRAAALLILAAGAAALGLAWALSLNGGRTATQRTVAAKAPREREARWADTRDGQAAAARTSGESAQFAPVPIPQDTALGTKNVDLYGLDNDTLSGTNFFKSKPVTITGSNFVTGGNVTFDGSPASSISAITPKHMTALNPYPDFNSPVPPQTGQKAGDPASYSGTLPTTGNGLYGANSSTVAPNGTVVLQGTWFTTSGANATSGGGARTGTTATPPAATGVAPPVALHFALPAQPGGQQAGQKPGDPAALRQHDWAKRFTSADRAEELKKTVKDLEEEKSRLKPGADQRALQDKDVAIRKYKEQLAALQAGHHDALSIDDHFKDDSSNTKSVTNVETPVTPPEPEVPSLPEEGFTFVKDEPLSTFSTDVDTASYSLLRNYLAQNQLPPAASIRIEEMLNYFPYEYKAPQGQTPLAIHLETAGCPWSAEHRLLRIALKAREIAWDQRPPSNLVFLLDISGSMAQANKLPLVKDAMKVLVERLGATDHMTIVVFSDNARVLLPSMACDQKQAVTAALDGLRTEGSTNGAGGMNLAYAEATKTFIQGGANRVIVCTDGDFNVGISDNDGVTKLIVEKAKTGVFLSVLGFGMGNIQDGKLQKIADHGNGHYAYIDTLAEARKVFLEQGSGTLLTVAKDAKLQVEFNPAEVAAYRLLGYEKRALAKEDFNNDKKDAGDIGAGHSVTALYELVPAGKQPKTAARVDPLKYQEVPRLTDAALEGELLTVRLRYKAPDAAVSRLLEVSAKDEGKKWAESSKDFRFAAAVACFGLTLRQSQFKGQANFALALELAGEKQTFDPQGYRAAFVDVVKKAQALAGKN